MAWGFRPPQEFKPHLVPPPDLEIIPPGKDDRLEGVLPLLFDRARDRRALHGLVHFHGRRRHRQSAGAIVVLIMRRRFTLRGFYQALLQAGMLSCSLLIIITFGNLFSFVLSSSGAIDCLREIRRRVEHAADFRAADDHVLYVLIGCMIDPVSMLIITLPAVMPIVAAYNWDPVWFGLIVITCARSAS
jgi:hypothetical protein